MEDASTAFNSLQGFLADYFKGYDSLRILEAGCGSLSRVAFPGKNNHIVGIDISQKQLDRNAYLSEKILGDLHDFPFQKGAFDAAICWDVIEHLDDPRKAIKNLMAACKPEGLLILGFPNLYSLKGVLTKFTPYPFHVWYYRYLLGHPEAGKEDQAPFSTPFRLAITHDAIRRFSGENGATVEFLLMRESHSMQQLRGKFPAIDFLLRASSTVSKLLTFGKIDAMHSDCIMVLRTPPAKG